MLGGNSRRHDHAPGVDDELPHLCLVDRGQPHPEPVVTQVGLNRHTELLWMGGDQCGALVLRKAEAHRQLVLAECHIDDPAHPKLDLIPDQRLFVRGNDNATVGMSSAVTIALLPPDRG